MVATAEYTGRLGLGSRVTRRMLALMLLVTVLLAISAYSSCLLPEADAAVPSIAGVLTDDAGVPMPDSCVTLYADYGWGWTDAGLQVWTDSAGRYEINVPGYGRYTLGFQGMVDTDYGPVVATEYWNDRSDLASADGFYAPQATTIAADVVLSPPVVSIGGHVAGQDGSALNDVYVVLYRWSGGYWQWTASASTSSDSSGGGGFAFVGLADGDYTLAFQRSWPTEWGDYWKGEIWQSKPNLAGADVVTVAGGTSNPLGVTLSPPVLSISGRVTDGNSEPVSAEVRLYRSDGAGGWIPQASTSTDSDPVHQGRYAFFDLPEGEYALGIVYYFHGQAVIQFWNGQASLAAADPIALAAGGVRVIDVIVTPPSLSIQGRVTDRSGNPLNSASVYVYAPDGAGGWTYFAATYTAYDPTGQGNFEFWGLPEGEYRIGFQTQWGAAYNYLYTTEFWGGSASVVDSDPVYVVEGQTTAVEAALSPPAAPVESRITDPSGNVLSGVGLELVPVTGYPYVSSARQTFADGVYRIWNVPDGQYYLRFSCEWPVGSSTVWRTEYWNGKSEAYLADIVTVTNGTTFVADTALTPPSRSISGLVTDPGGNPVDGVVVQVYTEDSYGGWVLLPDYSYTGGDLGSGRYEFWNLPTGRYRISYTHYWPEVGHTNVSYYDGKDTLAEADVVEVIEGTTSTADTAIRPPMKSLEGRVVDQDGTPLSGVTVQLYPVWQTNPDGYIASFYTDATGAYEFWGLAPGSYRLGFSKGFLVVGYIWITEYWQDRLSLSEADPIAVAAGATTSVGDATLSPPGPPANDDFATAEVVEGDVGSVSADARFATRESGEVGDGNSVWYRWTAPWDGDLTVHSWAYNFDYGWPTYVAASVSQGDTLTTLETLGSGIGNEVSTVFAVHVTSGQEYYFRLAGYQNLFMSWRLTPPAIEGVLTDDVGSPLESVRVTLYASDGSGGWAPSLAVETDPGGFYRFTNVPDGEYRVGFSYWWESAYGGAWGVSYWRGASTLDTADPVYVTAGQTFRGDAVLTPPTVAVSGVIVLDGTGAPASGVTVEAYVASSPGTPAATVISDESGGFTFPALTFGESYLIRFADAGLGRYVDEWYQDASSIETAAPVFVGGSGISLSAQVAPLDADAPVTTAALDSSLVVGEWRSAPTTVTLEATDVGLGVAGTYYRIGSDVLLYSGPFVVPEGTIDVAFWSVDGAGNIEAEQNVIVKSDGVSPTAPSGLAVVSAAKKGGLLAWDPSSDGSGSGVAGYLVFKNGELIGVTTACEFESNGLLAGGKIAFTVFAIDAMGYQSGSSEPLVYRRR